MDNDKINMAFNTLDDQLTILKGEANKRFDPVPKNNEFKGTIFAPSEFYSSLKNHSENQFTESTNERMTYESFELGNQNLVNPFALPFKENMSVEYSKIGGTIKFQTNRFSKHGNETVTGSLQLNPDLEAFQINTDHVWTTMDLSKFFKMNRTFFNRKEEASDIVSMLRNYKANVTQSIEQRSDDRGNRTDMFDQVVNSGIPETIKLTIPIYVGFEPTTFEVEICFEANNGQISVWLDSAELREKQIEMREKIFNDALAPFVDDGVILVELNS